MIAHTVEVDGAPCPTLVLTADSPRAFPRDEDELRLLLGATRRWLVAAGDRHVLKLALAAPAEEPGRDIEYRFAQVLPGSPEEFDLRAGCGHSLLAAVAALGVVTPVRVRITNTAETAVCVPGGGSRLSLRFVHDPPLRPKELLPTGNPTDPLSTTDGVHRASLVRLGNPYVFLDAADLGLRDRKDLFGPDAGTLLPLLHRLRASARPLIGLADTGALPKIALVGAFQPGRLSVRMVTVPGWHPGVAITGATSLAAARTVPGTLPRTLAERAGCPAEALCLDTPSGTARAAARTRLHGSVPFLQAVGVAEKRVRVLRRRPLPAWRAHATA